MKILFVKSIFCPNINFFNTCIKSIINMNIFVNLIDDIECDILIIGWIKNFKKRLKLIIKMIPLKFSNIYINIWNINYGKYYMLNRMLDYCKENNSYDLLIYLDHDIEFSFNKFNIIRLALKSYNYLDNENIGLVAFNQLEDVRHQKNIYENEININGVKYIYPNNFQSIACGAYYISYKIFSNLNRFEIKSVYGLDDYYLLKQLHEKGYNNIVIKNYFVIHPFNKIEKYDKWKIKSICDLIEYKNINYFKAIEDSNNLWI